MSTEDSPDPRADRPPLALIAGPTASGKSDLAVRLALAIEARGRKAVVINADSAQVYADLAVLSARPTVEEMRGIEHRLFGDWDGAVACSAADWAAAARSVVAEVQRAGGVPVLVGGTGLYIRTLLEGIAPVPEIDPQVRSQVRALPATEAYAALVREDPRYAAGLAPGDRARVARALEVVRSTGRSLSQWHGERVGGIAQAVALHAAILLPDRHRLYERCDRRFAGMIAHGAVDEVARLLARGLAPSLPVMRAIGVAEITGFLQNRCTLAEAEARGAQATRNYAKRQYTWFRHQHPCDWPRLVAQDLDPGIAFASLLHN